MATRTWISNVSTDANLVANYSGAGALLTTDDLVYNGTGAATAILTAALSVASITISSTASFTCTGFAITINGTGGFVCSGSGSITMATTWSLTFTGAASSTMALTTGPTYSFYGTVSGGIITIANATFALNYGANIACNRLVTATPNQVITWTPTAFTLTIAQNSAANWSGSVAGIVEWKSATPGTRYLINVIGASGATTYCKVTDCQNARGSGTYLDFLAATNVNGGNNMGFSFTCTTVRVNYATGSDEYTGETWALAVKKIDRANVLSNSLGGTALCKLNQHVSASQTATWPAVGSKIVNVTNLTTLTLLIAPGGSGWTANPLGDVTIGYAASIAKYGTLNLTLTFDAAVQASILQAYYALPATLDLAAFQKVSFWSSIGATATMPANSLVIKLCSDAAGATPVATLTLAEAANIQQTNQAFTLDNGGSLGNGINSIAIYTGAVTPAASGVWRFDAFYACNNLHLNSVIHKPYSSAWAANTVYAPGAVIQPTWPAIANGQGSYLTYICTVGGTSHVTTEPTWNNAVIDGDTITDGTVTWAVQGWNEAFYHWLIKSFQTTYIEIDGETANVTTAGRGFYGTPGNTVLWYTPATETAFAAITAAVQATTVNGTDAAPCVIKGGADTDDVIKGMTVYTGRNSYGYGFAPANNHITVSPTLEFNRYYCCVNSSSSMWLTVGGLYSGAGLYGLSITSQGTYPLTIKWLITHSHASLGFSTNTISYNPLSVAFISMCTKSTGLSAGTGPGALKRVLLANNTASGMYGGANLLITRLTTRSNANAITFYQSGYLKLDYADLGEAAETSPGSEPFGFIFSRNHDGFANSHYIFWPYGYASYAIATHIWTYYVTNALVTTNYSQIVPIADVICDVASQAYTVSIQVTPSNAAIFGRLRIYGNALPGIPQGLVATSVGAGLQTLTLTFTPTQVGRVLVYLEIYVSSGTTHNLTWDEDSLSCVRNGLPTRVFAGIFLNALPSTLAMPDADTWPLDAKVNPDQGTYGRDGVGHTASQDLPAITSVVPPDTLEGVTGTYDLAAYEASRNTAPAGGNADLVATKTCKVAGTTFTGTTAAEAHTDDEVIDSASEPGNYKVGNLIDTNVRNTKAYGLTGVGSLVEQDAAFFQKTAPAAQIGH